ncbi:MAG: DUF87 domain-containing protein [Bauldia sp.]|nr:DUF87 domain-containing protein [Bauldia sp.]MCW5717926.1 DUF87 domain-containing protein [Bauldia sp.]
MLFVGTQTNDANRRIEIDFDGLLHHTLIVGQSGSGKSFLVARIIEEILTRSRARILVLDPNGDFRRVSVANKDIWNNNAETLSKLDHLTTRSGIESFDNQVAFDSAWKKRRFVHLSPTRSPQTPSSAAASHLLWVHWDSLDSDQRSFLLNASSATEPKVFLGLKAVAENARWMSQRRPGGGVRLDLRGLLEVAKQFAESNVSMREYEYAKNLTRDDWYAVQAKIDDLLSQYTIWWSSIYPNEGRPSGLADFVDGSFEGNTRLPTYWDALVLSLESAPSADSLLAAEVALSRLWLKAKGEWRKRAEGLSSDGQGGDGRVPTFIVIDEAHNFAPDQPTDKLRNRVTARLMQIASEGRKYGLYLILASQRPTKLHRELVSECENACVLRLQSKIETDFAVQVLGLSDAEAHSVPAFTKGQGVFFGRWVGGTAQLNTKIAPARIVVGGGEIGHSWKTIPDETPPASPLSSVAEFLRTVLREATKPIDLATLAALVRAKFGEAETLHWYGRASFKALISDLEPSEIVFDLSPPGFAYLRSVQHGQVAGTAEGLGAGVDDEVGATISLVRKHFDIPVSSRTAFRGLFEAISAEVQANEFNLSDTSKAIRDRCMAAGNPVARSLVNFVLKGAYLSGHRFVSDVSQSPSTIASAFLKSVFYSLRKDGIRLAPRTEEIITEFYSGGILETVPVVGTETLVVTAGSGNDGDTDHSREESQTLLDAPLAVESVVEGRQAD